MRVSTISSFAPYNSYNDPSALIQYLLEAIAKSGPTDYACVLSATEDRKRAQRVAECFAEDAVIPDDSRRTVLDLLQDRLNASSPASEPALLSAAGLDGTPFRSGIVYPLMMPDETLGVLGLFSRRAWAYDGHQIAANLPQIALIRTLLENIYMYNLLAQNLIVTQSIQLAAREIADNPSPQHVVNILRDYFFDAHVTSCALLLYGPTHEGRPNGPFDYMEVRGTWSKRRGSGVGVGVRFYLDNLPDLLQQLDREEILVFPRASELSKRLDPLLRVFLQAERVRSMCLLALHANNRKLGVIFVGTDKRHDFSTQELYSYRTVSEFLAINVMTQMLQLQHDRVQQGRAALLDAVTDGVLMVMPGSSGARVLTVNRRFVELFELPDTEYQDRLLSELLDQLPFAENQRVELRKTWLAIPVRDPATQKGEFHMTNREGHPVDVEWYSAPVYQEQTVLGRIYIFHDVTAERTANRLRAAFLSQVSHELRTPLTAIRGSAEFILELHGRELPDRAYEYTERILTSAKHLHRMFSDLLDQLRTETGELKLYPQKVFLPDIIIDVVARLELMHKERNQKVVMELDDDLPPVFVDVDRMIQVLQNLMTNAIKYAPEGTTIRITTGYVDSMEALPPGAPPDVILPAVLVRVADEGKGLTKEEADNVFMPFYRTDDAKKRKIEGVGLGLHVTRSIIELMRGRIWAEPNSKDRTGGLFLFTIPTLERKSDLPAPTPP